MEPYLAQACWNVARLVPKTRKLAPSTGTAPDSGNVVRIQRDGADAESGLGKNLDWGHVRYSGGFSGPPARPPRRARRVVPGSRRPDPGAVLGRLAVVPHHPPAG